MLATLIVWGHPSGTPAAQNSPYTPAAGSLPRRLSEAQAYATFTSGASCEGNGAGSITTLADCSAAAAALGLSDTTAVDDGQDGVSWNPPYCYFELVYAGGGSYSLKFNSAGTNTGSCTSGWYGELQTATATDICICWLNAPPPPSPYPPGMAPTPPPSPPPTAPLLVSSYRKAKFHICGLLRNRIHVGIVFRLVHITLTPDFRYAGVR